MYHYGMKTKSVISIDPMLRGPRNNQKECPDAGYLARLNDEIPHPIRNPNFRKKNIRELLTETPMNAAIVMDVGRSSLMAAILVCWLS